MLVINVDVLCEEVGTDSCFVLCAEPIVDVLTHEARFADRAVAENDDLQKRLLAAVAHFGTLYLQARSRLLGNASK